MLGLLYFVLCAIPTAGSGVWVLVWERYCALSTALFLQGEREREDSAAMMAIPPRITPFGRKCEFERKAKFLHAAQ